MLHIKILYDNIRPHITLEFGHMDGTVKPDTVHMFASPHNRQALRAQKAMRNRRRYEPSFVLTSAKILDDDTAVMPIP